MVKRLDLLLLQEPEHVLLELTRSLARNDLDQRRLRPHRLVDDVAQGPVDVVAPVIDVVQIEFELHWAVSGQTVSPTVRGRRPSAARSGIYDAVEWHDRVRGRCQPPRESTCARPAPR